MTAFRWFPLLLVVMGCKIVTIEERQFLDPRPASLPDSVRVAGPWPASLRLSERMVPMGDSIRLYSVRLDASEEDLAILYFGGSNFQIGQDYARFAPLGELGVDVVVVDYPGYGGSEGTASLAALQDAALVAYDEALRATGLPAERLVVHGHSLGSMIAGHVASLRPIGGLVLEGPATNVDEWARTFTPWYARPFVRYRIEADLRRADNLARVGEYTGPLLVLAGGADRDTDPSMARRLFAGSASPPDLKRLVVLDGTGHMIVQRDPRAIEAYRAFLDVVRASGNR